MNEWMKMTDLLFFYMDRFANNKFNISVKHEHNVSAVQVNFSEIDFHVRVLSRDCGPSG